MLFSLQARCMSWREPTPSPLNGCQQAGVTIKYWRIDCGQPSSLNRSGQRVTIDGLTITSDEAYAVEFIQIGGSNHRIINNTIFGPEQAGPSTGWVVNRGFVTQANNATDILVRNNIFFSLRQPAYLNPNTTGHIIGNVVYNTRGFVVDRAVFVFSGNSWGIPDNAVDIALLTGTISGPPYDPLTILSANNSNASIEPKTIKQQVLTCCFYERWIIPAEPWRQTASAGRQGPAGSIGMQRIPVLLTLRQGQGTGAFSLLNAPAEDGYI